MKMKNKLKKVLGQVTISPTHETEIDMKSLDQDLNQLPVLKKKKKKLLKKVKKREINQFTSVLKLQAFKQDPLHIIQLHLQNQAKAGQL